MIFVIDEDMSAFGGWLAELSVRGYEVVPLWDADEAYETLKNVGPDEVDLVVVDVMLAVSATRAAGLSAEDTDDYFLTGLRLVEKLRDENPQVFPDRAVFLTNVVNKARLALLRKASEDLGIELWRKHRIATALEFADLVDRRIEALGSAL